MAIKANDLDRQIKDAWAEYNNGAYKDNMKNPKYLKIMGDEMKKYFEENTEISYTWSALLPPPVSAPDPVVKFDSKVEFPSFDLTPAIDLITLAVLVQTAILGGVISHASGFSVAPGSFLMKSPLFLPLTQDANSAIFSCIVSPTCAWVLDLANPAPLAGAHGPYSGATTGMVIK
jgi:hypothetical protein